jgi:cytochrome c oxidase subunit 2
MSLPSAQQSALSPQGAEAAGILDLMQVLVWGGGAVLLLVVVLTALALRSPRPRWARTSFVVAGGIAFPAVVLSALMVYALAKETRLALVGAPQVAIELVGHQWWWQVRYLGPDGQLDFTTANEVRIPANASVELRLSTADVLHSFWVPSLAGKLDLIPGRENALRIVARDPGTFRGQCAEYCGGPHGQMALFVVAEAPERFEAWRAAQRRPQAAAGHAGAAAFLEHCGACHAIRGTPAEGTLGPDLTHLASRVSLGAGILPNDPQATTRWIASSQHVKPGNLMPEFGALDPAELRRIVEYLGTLQ